MSDEEQGASPTRSRTENLRQDAGESVKELGRPPVLKPRELAELQSAPDRHDLRSDPSANVIKRRRGTRPSDRLPLSHETCF